MVIDQFSKTRDTYCILTKERVTTVLRHLFVSKSHPAEYPLADPSSNVSIIGQDDRWFGTPSHSRTTYRSHDGNALSQMAGPRSTSKNSTTKYLRCAIITIKIKCLSDAPISRYDHAIWPIWKSHLLESTASMELIAVHTHLM
jgi:hypothetical protein